MTEYRVGREGRKVHLFPDREKAVEAATRTKKWAGAKEQCVAIDYDRLGRIHYWYVHKDEKVYLCVDGYWRRKENTVFHEDTVEVNEVGGERTSEDAHNDVISGVIDITPYGQPTPTFWKGGRVD